MEEPALNRVIDELAVRDLVARFADAVNHQDPQAIRELFVPDGEFAVAGWTSLRGAGEVVNFLSGVISHWDVIFQAVHPGRVFLAGDTARGEWYITEYGRYRDGQETFLGGLYSDDYLRTPEGWRFARRGFRGMFRRQTPAPDGLQVRPPLPPRDANE
jgi:hypothetical protein